MARTKELYQELEEVKEEENEHVREMMELEGFGDIDEKRSEIENTLQKLTEGQRKFLKANYGDNPDELKKQAERTLYFLKRAEETMMSPQQKRNQNKAIRRGQLQ